MNTSTYVFIALGVAVLFVAFLFNRLVALRQAWNRAFADIDVQLKLRHDLIPSLVETVKGYAAHERGVFTAVTEARAQAMRASGVADKSAAEGALSGALANLFAVAENYPQLKASEPFRHLQERISGLETALADRREVYNDAVNTNNVRIDAFPDVLVARLGDFPPGQLLHFQADQKSDVDLSAAFSR